MRETVKNKALGLLTASAALCLGGAIAFTGGIAARAEEEAESGTSYYAYVNVGADENAKLIDAALGLEETDYTPVTAGTETKGGSLFEGYSVNASYSFNLEEGEYQIAVAIVAEQGTAVKVNGAAVDVAGKTGKCIVSTNATVGASGLTVEVTGKLCGVLVSDPESKALMAADYTASQIISYGAPLSDLEGATGYFSDGATEEVEIDYNGVAASTGLNVNFTMVEATGVVKGTELAVSRNILTMPDDLVYFINCGSYNVDGYYVDTADPYYEYNQMVFDYYKTLKNNVPDQEATGSGWGYYTGSLYTGPYPGAAFPYNSIRWTGADDAASGAKGIIDMGYYLTGLEAGQSYRIYIGSMSHWHARSVDISFNGTKAPDKIRINSSKGYTVYEVTPDASGKIDIYMKGSGTNEPLVSFIAVQKASTVINEAPTAVEGPSIIGIDAHSLALTNGVQEGAKIQLYNAARPNYILYEEMVDPEKIVPDEEGDGYTYEVDWGELFEDVSRFYVVQVTNGGVSDGLLVSITDIEGFEAIRSPEGYSTGAIDVTIKAHANSGIVSWSYQFGEYGVVNTFDLDKPYEMNETFTAEENGEYYIVITSGLGVTYSDTVVIGEIDPDRPVIAITPSKEGWVKGAYNVSLAVRGTAPVAEYKLYKSGTLVASSQEAPTAITFAEAGEYVIYVKNGAGQSTTSTICVSEQPTTTSVTSNYAQRTLTYKFGDTDDFTIAAVSAYEVTDTGVSRMTIASGNTMDVYNAGTYVVTVTTSTGAVEMFSLDVTAADLSNKKQQANDGNNSGGASDSVALGVGIGVGVGGIVIAAAAVTVTILLVKKKKS